ncbi:MAG: hypothetical protein CTY18_03005 [Methylomonas sp.]|nr:MAG: hypothetical protein CTY18_03005 [Methylomonas sp.]
MGRNVSPNTIDPIILTPEEIQHIDERVDNFNQLAAAQYEANENAVAVAKQVGYEGEMTIGALEDGIRFYQRRTVEDVLQLGKYLLMLKELSAHGEFQKRVELLGMAYHTAKKFMAATLKFSKGSPATLLAAGNQKKLLELLTLDDAEIKELESGETVRGLVLDDIETMSASELRRALREAKDDKIAKDKVIADKSAELDRRAIEIKKLQNDAPVMAHIDWPEAFKGFANQAAYCRHQIRQGLGGLEIIRAEAIVIQPDSEEEEQALNVARDMLARELISIHNDMLQTLEDIGYAFDKSLGMYTDGRIKLVLRNIGQLADDE